MNTRHLRLEKNSKNLGGAFDVNNTNFGCEDNVGKPLPRLPRMVLNRPCLEMGIRPILSSNLSMSCSLAGSSGSNDALGGGPGKTSLMENIEKILEGMMISIVSLIDIDKHLNFVEEK